MTEKELLWKIIKNKGNCKGYCNMHLCILCKKLLCLPYMSDKTILRIACAVYISTWDDKTNEVFEELL